MLSAALKSTISPVFQTERQTPPRDSAAGSSRLGNERFAAFWKDLCGIADLEEDSLVAVPVCAMREEGIKTAGRLVRPDTKEVYVL